jgi:uncharacterized membrane protein
MALSLIMPMSGTDTARIDLFIFIDEWVVIPSALVAFLSGIVLAFLKGQDKRVRVSYVLIKSILTVTIIFGGFIFVKTVYGVEILMFLLPVTDKVLTQPMLFFPLAVLAVVLLCTMFTVSFMIPSTQSQYSSVEDLRLSERPVGRKYPVCG